MLKSRTTKQSNRLTKILFLFHFRLSVRYSLVLVDILSSYDACKPPQSSPFIAFLTKKDSCSCFKFCVPTTTAIHISNGNTCNDDSAMTLEIILGLFKVQVRNNGERGLKEIAKSPQMF